MRLGILFSKSLDDFVVDVSTSEIAVACNSFDSYILMLKFDDGNVQSAATKVINEDMLIILTELLFENKVKCDGNGLFQKVEQSEIDSITFACSSGCGSLVFIKVSWHGYYAVKNVAFRLTASDLGLSRCIFQNDT